MAGATIIAPARAADVVSSNIVGYYKLDTSTGYTMVGSSFQAVGGNNIVDIQTVKGKGLTGVDWTFQTEAGDTLLLWNPEEQAYSTELNYTGDSDPDGLMDAFGATPGTWFDMGNFKTADNELVNGAAFWIKSTSDSATVTLSGEVPETAPAIELSTGYNMIANPYPKAVDVNELFTATGLTGVDWTFQTEAGDSLMIWSPEEQAYSVELLYTGDSDPDGLMDAFGATPGTWFDMGNFKTADNVIPVGGAFWIKSSGSGTLTFK